MITEYSYPEFFKFYKVRNVKSPSRGTEEAAGIDFFVPELDDTFVADLVKKNKNIMLSIDETNTLHIHLQPGQRVLIPSGIKCMIAKGTALIAANKSGVSTKKGLRFTAQVVDSDYSGEVHLGVANDSDEQVIISSGEKLIQFIHTPVILSTPVECTEKNEFDDFHSLSARKDKGFGSNISMQKA